MKKYAIPGLFILAGHEVISILALVVAFAMFLADIIGEYSRKDGFYK